MLAEEARAVVYPASIVGSLWPVPTWNLLTARQSVQAAGIKLPAKLSASVRAGATLFAMMGDQSLCRRGEGNIRYSPFSLQAAIANDTCSTFRCTGRPALP